MKKRHIDYELYLSLRDTHLRECMRLVAKNRPLDIPLAVQEADTLAFEMATEVAKLDVPRSWTVED